MYDEQDLKIQRFFARGSHPKVDDLVNAYHTTTLATASGEKAVTIREMQAISPLSQTKMKLCLAFFVNRSIVVQAKRGSYRLNRLGLNREDLERAGRSYQDCVAKDLVRTEAIRDYATNSGCRWKRILKYFDSDELHSESCHHCDVCRRFADALRAG